MSNARKVLVLVLLIYLFFYFSFPYFSIITYRWFGLFYFLLSTVLFILNSIIVFCFLLLII